MKLKLELDLENPSASMVYLDGRKVGGISELTLSASVERNTFYVDVKGWRRLGEKERQAWTLGSPQRISGSVCGILFGQQSEWTKTSAAQLAESLQPNLSKK